VDDFEADRDHLRAVAYRMLGAAGEADDAVQEAWLRLARTDASVIENRRAWLTTVVARVCLDMLRARAARREVPFPEPEPQASAGADASPPAAGSDPEQEAALAESVGLALLVVLDALSPAERLAFVLHDMFCVPFQQIAAMLDRSVPATKMLASRARHRVRTARTPADDPARQAEVVHAFLAATREGDFEALIALLHPGVIVRADAVASPTGAPVVLRGSKVVAGQARMFARQAEHARLGCADEAPAILVEAGRRLIRVLSFTITGGTISAIDIIADPTRLARLHIDPL
jgi:RNA polymerase sigma-70 factor (ECF subfamily)